VPRGIIEFAIWRYVGFPEATNHLGFTNLTSVNMHLRDWLNKGHSLEFGLE
jgi:hypothetical protein